MPDLFAIINTTTGQAILTGPLDMLLENIPDTLARNDAEARLCDAATQLQQLTTRLDQRQADLEQREANLAHAVTIFTDAAGQMVGAFEARKAEQKAEAEEQERQEYMAALPDPDNAADDLIAAPGAGLSRDRIGRGEYLRYSGEPELDTIFSGYPTHKIAGLIVMGGDVVVRDCNMD
jgi:hypothetical protein